MRTRHERSDGTHLTGKRTALRSRILGGIGALLIGALLLPAGTASADPRDTHAKSSSYTTIHFGRSDDVASAISAWKRNHTHSAIASAMRALEGRLHPRDYRDASSIVCMGRTALDQAAEAIIYCENALRHGGAKDWRHVNNLAIALFHAGRHEEAIVQYERSIALVGAEDRALTERSRSERERVLAEVLRPNLRLAEAARAGDGQVVERAGTGTGAPAGDATEPPITRLAGSAD